MRFLYLFCLMGLLFCGCVAAPKISPDAKSFLEKNEELVSFEAHETSLFCLSKNLEDRNGDIMVFLRAAEISLGEELEPKISKLREKAKRLHLQQKNQVAEIKSSLADGDKLYWYEIRTSRRSETGVVLVGKGGQTKRKWIDTASGSATQ